MTASSQTHPGAEPPSHPPYAEAAAIAQAAPTPPTPFQTTVGVIRAAMANGPGTAQDIAQVLQDTGVILSPQRAQDIWNAAYEQANAEHAAEAAADREARAWFHARWKMAGQLCEGRHPEHMLMVGDVLAALDGKTPTTAPLTITWDGTITRPAGDGPGDTTLVAGTTARGGRAALVLDDEQRQALASLLNLQVRDINAPCPTDGCGADHDWDPSNPFLVGWSRLEIAALGDGPRWYCSDMCVFDALARAGHDIAADDRQAAVDPDQQAPVLLTPEATTGWETVTDNLDRRYGPGASDEYALQQAEAAEAGFEDERGDDAGGAL